MFNKSCLVIDKNLQKGKPKIHVYKLDVKEPMNISIFPLPI